MSMRIKREMGDVSPDKKSGCGLFKTVFGQRSFWSRRSVSSRSSPKVKGKTSVSAPSTQKRQKNGSNGASFSDNSQPISDGSLKPITRASDHPKNPPVQHHIHHRTQHQQNYGRKPAEEATKISPVQVHVINQYYGYPNQGRMICKEAVGISGELESMIADHQRTKGNSMLVRASSSNFMLFGNLGNLRQSGGGSGGGGNTDSYNVLDYLPKTAREANEMATGKYPNSVMGNVVKKPLEVDDQKPSSDQPGGSLCRALSTKMDPERLKIMGNEDYKNGNFAVALALYDAAISINPNKASYRSNKSAALTALGRLLEAVFECREAIRIEPHYYRAHHRLANLYLRLGDGEKAIYHYKHSGPEADDVDTAKAKGLQLHLTKCTEARRLRDWNALIKETKAAISSGADSAPQIYSLQAEALLKLRRHQEADEALTNGPNFRDEDCTKYFGPIGSANLLMIRTQVDMAVGRFDDALSSSQRATRLDPNNKEANMVMRKARAMAAARSTGNQLFKAAKYYEASNAYGEGLELDPCNSVLLCNRAACRSKLGQYEKGVEDCNIALNVRPNYSKARLRRADCYAKLEKWEASIQDYEILHKEAPEDEEVREGLFEAKAQLKKHSGGDMEDKMKHGGA